MLFWLGEHLQGAWGPLGLLSSYLFLAGLGPALAAIMTWILLPRFWERMPRDRGRAFAVGAVQSQGKPTGTGFIFILIYVLVCLLVAPLTPIFLETLACILFAMLTGFWDDQSEVPWHEYKKAALDALIVGLTAVALCQLKSVTWWFPFVKQTVLVPPVIFVPLAAALLWFSINATNCTDGVDGLSGSLCALAFLYLGGLLFIVVGHKELSSQVLVPYNPAGAEWAIMAFAMVGVLSGYLWYNANPSLILMGDAGSRALGLLLGVLVLASGNPFLILAVGGLILVNGGTGLIKVSLKRFFNIEFLWNIRFPLHDHMKQNLKWSNPQVLVRFVLLQALLTPLLLLIFIKLR
jgi:phospho-N-acetylmuramoyl-pentapeptide-transferase